MIEDKKKKVGKSNEIINIEQWRKYYCNTWEKLKRIKMLLEHLKIMKNKINILEKNEKNTIYVWTLEN